MRIGHGYDVHRLTAGRKLVLGGVEIPFELGLLGHSDADVLCHAISDALLGALALGDIGKHFPDSDPAYKGADSLALLGRVAGLVREKGYGVVNIDATLILQRPKVAPYVMADAREHQPGSGRGGGCGFNQGHDQRGRWVLRGAAKAPRATPWRWWNESIQWARHLAPVRRPERWAPPESR